MRMGRKKSPFYRVVVAETSTPRSGKYIENLGYYDPTKKPQVVELHEDRVKHWLSVGAQPSDTARSLFRQHGILRRIHEEHVGTKGEAASGADSAE